ncbi:MAG: DUF2281 domain-containing protein [Chitinispirillales bacterium]|jgi:hypothetical protein|nr:DUF2281 domain-containing protein [Chitinispirillales bacterium]
MTTTELLIEEIRALPPSRVGEVLDFVEFLKSRETRAAEAGNAGELWFENGSECPICAGHRYPATREGEPRFNAETVTAFKEGDAMLMGKAPANWHSSVEDLDKMLGL